jgi:transcriptional regulator with PAS, ATPase and Fis domain
MATPFVTAEDVRRRIVHSANSPMATVLGSLARIAQSNANVLVTGESGAGKELIVRAIHDLSPMREGRFVPINCGAIPKELMETELFGHEKGSFTGATQRRQGRVELANNGTLFLDEIGDMQLDLQVKLLRVLQEREYEPVGSSERKKANFRLVTATNCPLEDLVVEGKFRQDLFFRIDVVRIHLPPLRERPMDISLLAEHFLEKYRSDRHTGLRGFSASAMAVLEGHRWSGNVRELENVIQSILVLKDSGLIHAEDVAAKLQARLIPQAQATPGVSFDLPEDGLNLKDALERLEQHLIRQALRRASGNKAQAAQLLGINRTTLVEKLKRKPIADFVDN